MWLRAPYMSAPRKMPKLTYADEIDARFGIPWPEGQLEYAKGELRSALTPEQIDALSDEQSEVLSRLLIDQPESEKRDPIEWGWTLPSWRRRACWCILLKVFRRRKFAPCT